MLGVSGIISDGGGESGGGGGGGGATSGGSSEIGVGGGGSGSGGGFMTEEDRAIRNMEEGERNSSGGNRWPRQETIALLKIRSEMDITFRDSSLKGPLWQEVSRKLAELGYHRSAKKCKEKFENVYKYHKRTKDGRASKADGKNYRFFEQLEALENTPSSHHHSLLSQSNSRPPPPPLEATPINMAMPMPTSNVQGTNTTTSTHHHVTVSSAPPQPPPPLSNNPFAPSHQMTSPVAPSLLSSQPSPQPPAVNPINNIPHQVNTTNFPSHQNISAMSYSTSSSTSSDEDIQRKHRIKKRKWKNYFDKLTRDLINKQEESQRVFLEKFEQKERERMVREEAWKVEEMARMKREHDLLVQEREMAAAKDAAVLSFLQKITEQKNIQIPNNINVAPPQSTQVQIQLPENPPPAPTHTLQPHQQTVVVPSPSPPASSVPIPLPITIPAPISALVQSLPLTPPVPPRNMELVPKSDNGGESHSPASASSSRWPKAEVEALIRLRTNLDVKYQENGPKGPLWEEISSAMKKIGYNRNAKRCKEKWENINKYFKKVKESNKKRPEDSKTCPYFHQLDALYKEKAKNETSLNPGFGLNPENNPMAPIMARPEQQWPLPQHHQHHESSRMDHDQESDNMDEDEEEDDEDEEINAYEIVASKQQSSMTTVNTTTTTTTTATPTTV